MKEENAIGKLRYVKIGEMVGLGLFRTMIQDLQGKIGYFPYYGPYEKGLANTAMMHHSQKTYALIESDVPFNLQVERSKDKVDIHSKGYDKFDGTLKHNTSAHPKVDKRTGEFFAFGYSLFGASVTNVTIYDAKRKFKSHVAVPNLGVRLNHDYLITEKFLVLPDLPLCIDPLVAIQDMGFIGSFKSNEKCRYGVMPRYSTDPNTVKWFDFPKAHYVFHFANAWDWINDKGEQMVTVVAPVYYNMDLSWQNHDWNLNQFETDFCKFHLNLATGELDIKNNLCPLYYLEFPILNPWYVGYKTRYTYMVYRDKIDEARINIKHLENVMFDGFVKYDMLEEKIVKKVQFGETC